MVHRQTWRGDEREIGFRRLGKMVVWSWNAASHTQIRYDACNPRIRTRQEMESRCIYSLEAKGPGFQKVGSQRMVRWTNLYFLQCHFNGLFVGVFLESLDDLKHPLSADYVSHMDSVYSFSTSKNAEIISRFFGIAMKGRWDEIYPDVAKFLASVGRMKFVRPGYRGLNEVDRELAVKTFRENEMFYHPICRAMVKKDLKLD